MQLATERLLLRPFVMDDAPAVQRLVSAYEIAENTLLIPHPYPEGAAAEWIGRHPKTPDNHNFAIALRDGGDVMLARPVVNGGVVPDGRWHNQSASPRPA